MINDIKKKIKYYLIPFLLGCTSSFSLPPYNLIFINFFVFPLLLLILINLQKSLISSWLNFKIGWFFGFGYFISNIYWITYSLTFEDIFKPLIPFSLVLIPSFLAIFYGIVTLISSRFKLKKKISAVLIFSLIFGLVEFFRSFILGGFPWNLISFSWVNYLKSLQILSVIGTYSFNLLSITIFTLPLLIFFQKNLKKKIYLTILIFLILSANYLYGNWKIKNDEIFYTEFRNLKIKIVSPKIEISRFFEYGNEEEIIEELIELSNPNLSQETIFVFPEGALAGVNFEKLKSFKNLFLTKFSKNHTIIMGINTEKNNQIFNSMIILDNNLKLLDEYNKIKLVPFGEFLPLEGIFKKFGLKKVSYGYKSFSKGDQRNKIFLENKNFSFIPLICYEIIYSGNIYSQLDKNDFIINISEDGWFGNSIGPYQHFSHTIFRSIEEGINIIRSANNGISAFIDSNGIVIAKLESTQRGVIEVNRYKKNEKTLFSKNGNKIFFYFVLFYTSLLFFIYKRETKNEERFFIYK
tara:strand:- start:603 stop:2171 length:1569 start_codon:yes stop_codon:yes gene_type:complete